MEVVSRTSVGVTGFVADDASRDSFYSATREKPQYARKWNGVVHASPIDIPLHFRPRILFSTLTQVIAYVPFRGRQVRGNQALLTSNSMKQLVIADNRVIEVNANPCTV